MPDVGDKKEACLKDLCMKPNIQYALFDAPDQIVRHVLCGLPLSNIDLFARPIATNIRETFLESIGEQKVGTETVIMLRRLATDHIRQYLMGFDSIPKVLYVLTGNKATDFYRATQVSRVLNERGKVMVSCAQSFDLATASFFDIIVFVLESRPQMIKMADALKKMGKKLVYDIDDCIDKIPETVVSSKVFTKERVDVMFELMSKCDAITAPTEITMNYYRRHTRIGDKYGCCVPNCLFMSIMPQAVPKDDGIFRIVFAGSPSHQDDLRMVKDAIIEIKRKHNKSVEYTFIGLSTSELAAVFGGWRDFNATGFVDFENYFDTLAETNADLGIAPLLQNDFSRCKSPIKAVEYIACGIPCLLSHVPPFTYLRDVSTSRMFATDWRKNIEEFIEAKKTEKMRGILYLQRQSIEDYDVAKSITNTECFFTSFKDGWK